eukprot:Rhum_TRINITY_DN14870_c27_g1::Rhum_TRINITY_DN14870_c27_g1_i1::g.126348::m.126348/K13304/SGK3; serum/glucocorticoid-regulated kinase 3
MGLAQTKAHAASKLKDVSDDDRDIVETTWAAALKSVPVDEIVSSVYSDLLSRDEGVRHILSHTKAAQRKRMLLTVVDWLRAPPSLEVVQVAAVQHAHWGVRTHHVDLLCASLGTVAAAAAAAGRGGGGGEDEGKGASEESVRAAWARCLQHLSRRFAPTCEDTCEALRHARDTANAMSTTDSAKKAKAIKVLTSPQPQPGFSGYLHMSQYSCVKRKPPQADSDHSLDCFRKRWIAMHAQYVYYYRHRGDEKPIGVIDLAACQLVDTDAPNSSLPSPPTKFSFALVTQSHDYPYYFISDGDDAKEHWYKQLRKSCNRWSLIRSDLNVGDRVTVWCRGSSSFEVGVAKWVGQLETDPPPRYMARETDGCCGLWVGVELREAKGDTNGTFGGHAYFECRDNYGLLVPGYEVKTTGMLDLQIEGEDLAASAYRAEDFDFLTVLGKGSFGRVCKVRNKKMGTIYACKVLQKAALVKESQIRNVSREKSILLNIRHPYIVKLHAAFQTRGRLFLLFDFLSGGELFYHMTQSSGRGSFPEARARFYIAEVSLAVHHLHEHNILHRDLKAENLVLDREGHVVLTDFGFAKTIDTKEANTTKCGTLPYMAPEMLRQGPNGYGKEVDWWALGVLLFLMLTGCYPFWAKEPMQNVRQILEREISPKSLPPMRPALTAEAAAVLAALLTKRPANRLSAAGFFSHPWMAGFDWVACRQRRLRPPFVPDTSGTNTKYFDTTRLSGIHSDTGAPPAPSAGGGGGGGGGGGW